VRLFFALWPPPEAARALAEWARAVEKACGGRATRENSIHLTLAFLGDADPLKAGVAGRKVRAAAFDFPLDAAGYWPHNRIVWIGPQRMPDALADLVQQLHRALVEEGFVLEGRAFAAHVTLLRKAARPAAIPPLPALTWPAPEFALVRSKPSPTGSAYEAIERFPLAGSR